jgi:hypothetical protein
MNDSNNNPSNKASSPIQLSGQSFDSVQQRVLECKNYGTNCNFAINKIISDTEKLVSRDYIVNPSTVKNDFINFIPKNPEFGYFDVTGNYHPF